MKYIDIEALGIGQCNPDVFEDKGYAKGWNAVIDLLQSMPVEDVISYRTHVEELDKERRVHMETEARLARPLGNWVELNPINANVRYYNCSICGRAIKLVYGEKLEQYPYCHCGAMMVKKEVRFDDGE